MEVHTGRGGSGGGSGSSDGGQRNISDVKALISPLRKLSVEFSLSFILGYSQRHK